MDNLGRIIGGRENNLNLIRLIAAFMVVFSHSFILSGNREPVTLFYNGSYGTLGLNIFFVMSGFLITKSYLRTQNPALFIWARVLRIFPALFCVVILSAFIIGPLITTLPIEEYLTNTKTYSYLLAVTLFNKQNHLPGVFASNSFRYSINGSLWMLKYMVAFYAFVLFLGVTKILNKKHVILAVFLSCLLLHQLNVGKSTYVLMFSISETVRLFMYFGLGMVSYLYRDSIPIDRPYFNLCVIILAIASAMNGLNDSLLVFVLTYLMLFFAFYDGFYIPWFSKIGDFSYGVFIYSFPVQQTVVHLHGGRMDPWLNFTISLLVSIALGAMSWHFCEQRFLHLKDLPFSRKKDEQYRLQAS